MIGQYRERNAVRMSAAASFGGSVAWQPKRRLRGRLLSNRFTPAIDNNGYHTSYVKYTHFELAFSLRRRRNRVRWKRARKVREIKGVWVEGRGILPAPSSQFFNFLNFFNTRFHIPNWLWTPYKVYMMSYFVVLIENWVNRAPARQGTSFWGLGPTYRRWRLNPTACSQLTAGLEYWDLCDTDIPVIHKLILAHSSSYHHKLYFN